MKKPPQKVAYLSKNFVVSEISLLKSVHFNKPVTQISFLSKCRHFLWNQLKLHWKWQHFERNEIHVTGFLKWTDFKTCSCSRLYGIYFCCLEPTYKSYQKALYSAAGFTKQWMKFWLIFVQIFRHIHDFTSEKRWKQAA